MNKKRKIATKPASYFIGKILIYLLIIIACLVSIYPILRVFSVSIRPDNQITSTSLAIISDDATFKNYIKVLFETDFLAWITNSFVLASTTSITGVLLAISAGYAFSRFRFPGRKTGLLSLFATQMIPAVMLLLPLYMMLSKLKLVNTYIGLIIAYSVTALPFTIWLLKGYFDSIPVQLEEAAMVDGCTQLGAFYRIILPLSKPAVAIALFFNFLAAWNDYLIARAIIQDPAMYTWTLGLTQFSGDRTVQFGLFAAASIMIALPTSALFAYLSKYFVSGLVLGALKE